MKNLRFQLTGSTSIKIVDGKRKSITKQNKSFAYMYAHKCIHEM